MRWLYDDETWADKLQGQHGHIIAVAVETQAQGQLALMCRLVVHLIVHLVVATQVVYGGKGQLILKAVTKLLMALHELLFLTSLVCTVEQNACLQRTLRPLHHKQGADSKCKRSESQHNLICSVQHQLHVQCQMQKLLVPDPSVPDPSVPDPSVPDVN